MEKLIRGKKLMFLGRKNTNGSITVFISLTMLFILAVVTTVIENSRVISAYTRATQASEISLESCFSSYAKEVFEDYGIMVLWKNTEEFEAAYREYLNKNINFKDIKLNYSDIYGLKITDASIENEINVLNNGGEYIANQIYDYMKWSLSEDIINKILDKCTSLSQNNDINEFYDDMEKCSDTMQDMENNVEVISDNVQIIKEIQYSPTDILDSMKTDLENIINTVGDDDYSKAVRDNYFETYKQNFRKYVSWENVAGDSLTNILDETDNYLVNIGKAKDYADLMRNNLETKKDILDKELYDLMAKEINDINENILNQDKDMYSVMANQKNAVAQKEITDNVKNCMSGVMEETRKLDYSYNKLSNYKNAEQLIKNSYSCVCNALIEISEYESSGLYVNYTKPQGKKKKNEIVEFVKKIKRDGVLGYITDGELSDKKINIDSIPSKIYSNVDYNWKKSGALEENARKALTGQYIFDKFNSFVQNRGVSPLAYEIEYIIEGKKSDKENLDKIVNKIIIIREGFNLIYLAKNSVKREEAYQMALAITGFTGMPVVIRITQFLILGAWAYAESIVDVKDLLAGYRVKLLKEENEWNLSLSGIKNLKSTDAKREKRGGLSYEDYLRVMLFTQNKSDQILRIMDMIEVNIQNKYNKNFKVLECMVGCSVSTEYEVKRVFSIIGYAKDYIVYKDDKFLIKIKQSFVY